MIMTGSTRLTRLATTLIHSDDTLSQGVPTVRHKLPWKSQTTETKPKQASSVNL